MTLTPEQLDELKRKHEAAFRAPWTYSRWLVECDACEGGSNTPESGECANPDCDGSDAPIVAVESPEEYPGGQLVAQISVPGLLSLADKNGDAIVSLHNAFPALEQLARFGLLAKAFCEEHGDAISGLKDLLAFRVALEALVESARALDGKEQTRLSGAQFAFNDLADSYQSVCEERDALRAELDNAKRAHEAYRKEAFAIDDARNAEEAKLRAELDKMTADHDDMWRNAMQSSARLGNAQERIDELEALLHSEREQRKNENLEMFEGLKAELDKAKGQLEAAEQSVKALSGSRDEAAAEVERLRHELKQAAVRLTAEKERVSELEGELRSSHRAVVVLKEENARLAKELEEHRSATPEELAEQRKSWARGEAELSRLEREEGRHTTMVKPREQPNDAEQEARLKRISDCIADGHWQNAMRHTVAYLKAERKARNGL